MFSLLTKPTGRALLALTVALACAPAVASAGAVDIAPGQDLRSPDTRDAANRDQAPTSRPVNATTREFASPDARDRTLAHERSPGSNASHANETAARIAARQDLRSPDTRDIADGRKYPPIPTVITLKEIPPQQPVPGTGFDWIAVMAGAASTLGVILLMTATAAIITRRRAHNEQPIPAS